MSSDKLQLRVPEALRARIRADAKKVGWTESQYVRYLLETSLGDDARMSALNQIVWSINARLQKRISEVGRVLRVELERIITEPDEGE